MPGLTWNSEPERVTDELRNLARKKHDAWLRLHDKQPPNNDLKLQYQHLNKLTRLAVKKAKNALWSAHAVEAEKQAMIMSSVCLVVQS